ncbi:LysR family transcriptional regulator [Endozoicomonas sp. OPT23]|uniref:LysR family transcriptional regulator n=1 Tax=Endozoicomonas sp. OPT23 TaxID=2072845 RepID=UPI00129ADF5F|nr:LysR family transcriptional regulator [Endozoicomonas sp. OPT23]MRI32600.1 LysR family transcriptional regulator [Endozoicomonas sp. OPT23]
MRLPLSTLEVFNAIVREGSMRAAANALGIKRSTVSHQLKALEDQLGTALFIRTTRTINLTEAGRALARSSGPAFEQLTDGLASARTAGHAERGNLKLALPELAYHLLLRQHLSTFQERYPEIEIELSLTDALSDILQEGLHAGFRLGGLVSEDMVAISLTGALNTAVVATPGYLKQYGRPVQPTDLLAHNCLRYRYPSSNQLAPWTFNGPSGVYPVQTSGSIITNSMPVTVEMATQGLGITYVFHACCAEALKTGQLEEVLSEHRVTMPSINIYFPRAYRDYVPLRLFIEHLKQGKEN